MEKFIAVVMIVLVVLVVMACCEDLRERERLTNQCLLDGHKEYECKSMLKSNDTYYFFYN